MFEFTLIEDTASELIPIALVQIIDTCLLYQVDADAQNHAPVTPRFMASRYAATVVAIPSSSASDVSA